MKPDPGPNYVTDFLIVFCAALILFVTAPAPAEPIRGTVVDKWVEPGRYDYNGRWVEQEQETYWVWDREYVSLGWWWWGWTYRYTAHRVTLQDWVEAVVYPEVEGCEGF